MSDIVLVSPPDISTAELLFNEDETRKILKFFWPSFGKQIDEIEVTDDVRRLGQRILIAGIDSSYALGFISQLKGLLSPQSSFSGLAAVARKLATHYIKHWWKHATQNDLRKPRVAEAVRTRIADVYRFQLELVFQGADARPFLHPFYIAATITTYWSVA